MWPGEAGGVVAVAVVGADAVGVIVAGSRGVAVEDIAVGALCEEPRMDGIAAVGVLDTAVIGEHVDAIEAALCASSVILTMNHQVSRG